MIPHPGQIKQNKRSSSEKYKRLDKRHKIVASSLPEIYKVIAYIGHGQKPCYLLKDLRELCRAHPHHAG